MDISSIRIFEYCKSNTNKHIWNRYRTLSHNAKQEIYILEYCKCLETQYTICLKQLKTPGEGLSNCQTIVDEYAIQGKIMA